VGEDPFSGVEVRERAADLGVRPTRLRRRRTEIAQMSRDWCDGGGAGRGTVVVVRERNVGAASELARRLAARGPPELRRHPAWSWPNSIVAADAAPCGN